MPRLEGIVTCGWCPIGPRPSRYLTNWSHASRTAQNTLGYSHRCINIFCQFNHVQIRKLPPYLDYPFINASFPSTPSSFMRLIILTIRSLKHRSENFPSDFPEKRIRAILREYTTLYNLPDTLSRTHNTNPAYSPVIDPLECHHTRRCNSDNRPQR